MELREDTPIDPYPDNFAMVNITLNMEFVMQEKSGLGELSSHSNFSPTPSLL